MLLHGYVRLRVIDMKKILVLTGVKGSGKTTTFNLIKSRYFPDAVEVTLAKKLKDTCSSVFGIGRNHLEDQDKKEVPFVVPITLAKEEVTSILENFRLTYSYEAHVKPHVGKKLYTPRQVAQYVGTEILRNVDEMVHCRGSLMDLKESDTYVVTDVRFWNEFDFFADRSEFRFIPIYVANSLAETNAEKDNHASERYVLQIAKNCHKLDNNGTMQQLDERLDNLLISIDTEVKYG